MRAYLLACVGLLALARNGGAQCAVRDKHAAAVKEVTTKEAARAKVHSDQKLALPTGPVAKPEAVEPRLEAAKRELDAKNAHLQGEERRLAEVQKEKGDFAGQVDKGTRLPVLKQEIEAKKKELADLETKISQSTGLLTAITKLETAIADREAEITKRLPGLNLKDLDAAKREVGDRGKTDRDQIAAFRGELPGVATGGDLTTNLSQLPLRCGRMGVTMSAIKTDTEKLLDLRRRQRNPQADYKALEAKINRDLQTLQAEAGSCESDAMAEIAKLEGDRVKLVPLQDQDPRPKRDLAIKQLEALEQELKSLTQDQGMFVNKVAEQTLNVEKAKTNRDAAQRLVTAIQAEYDVSVATAARDEAKTALDDAMSRRDEALKEAEVVRVSSDKRTEPAAKEALRAQIEAQLKAGEDYTQEELDLNKRQATMRDKAARDAADKAFQQKWTNRRNGLTNKRFQELRDQQVTRLRDMQRKLRDFTECWPEVNQTITQLEGMATTLGGRSSVVAGSDFEFSDDEGWERWPRNRGPASDELPDDISKYTTEEKIYFVRPGQWLSTGIQLKKGESFGITASGTVKADASWLNREWGPGGFYFLGFMAYNLKGLVGGKLIELGASGGGTAAADGELQLGITKTYEQIWPTDSRFTGGFKVTVSVTKRQ